MKINHKTFDGNDICEIREDYNCLSHPKKTNSRKSMVPLFTYLVIKAAKKPLSQKEITEALSSFPYEVCIERKALSRVIHGLEDSGIGIASNKKNGVWYDPKLEW